MSASHFQSSGKTSVGVSLGELSSVRSFVGMTHERHIEIRWNGCSKLSIGIEQAKQLSKLLDEAIGEL